MSQTRKRRAHRRAREGGYMLLVLMLAVAMLTITMLSVATSYRHSIQRDREVEMIHRGVQYERAVRLYYRRNNSSYPPSIERLEKTNGIRYLRKRYKDPMTPDGEWQIAHLTDVKLGGATGLKGASGLGSTGALDTAASSPSSAGDQSNSAATPATQPSAATGSITPAADSAGDATRQTGTVTPAQAPSSGGAGDQVSSGTVTSATGPANTSGGGAGPVLGGLAMIGVMSKSKAEGIHSFNDKSRYNDWLFIYDPSQETAQSGHLPNGPYNPKLTLTTAGVGNPGQTGSTPTPGGMGPGTGLPGKLMQGRQ